MHNISAEIASHLTFTSSKTFWVRGIIGCFRFERTTGVIWFNLLLKTESAMRSS